jgi:acyl-CoA thioesterase YciA
MGAWAHGRVVGGAVASGSVEEWPAKNCCQVMPMPDQTSPRQPLTGPTSLPDGSELVLRVMPLPADVNGNGDIFGGWLMAQVDLAGAVLPSRVAKGRIATVAVNQFIFKQPVSVGDLVSFYARITRIGNTSITVHVEVFAERNPSNLQVVKVTEANLTYVAIDGAGKPRAVPKD